MAGYDVLLIALRRQLLAKKMREPDAVVAICSPTCFEQNISAGLQQHFILHPVKIYSRGAIF